MTFPMQQESFDTTINRIEKAIVLTNYSSTTNKAGLNISTHTCKKKNGPFITQFSREGSVALTAYIEYILKWAIYRSICIVKSQRKSKMKPQDVMESLNVEWLTSIMGNSEIRPSNGLIFDRGFEDKFKVIYHAYKVNNKTRLKNKRKLDDQRRNNLFLFDVRNKIVKELPLQSPTPASRRPTTNDTIVEGNDNVSKKERKKRRKQRVR